MQIGDAWADWKAKRRLGHSSVLGQLLAVHKFLGSSIAKSGGRTSNSRGKCIVKVTQEEVGIRIRTHVLATLWPPRIAWLGSEEVAGRLRNTKGKMGPVTIKSKKGGCSQT